MEPAAVCGSAPDERSVRRKVCSLLQYLTKHLWSVWREMFYHGLLLSILVYSFCNAICAANTTQEALLFDKLFSSYNRDIRPGGDGGATVAVNIRIDLHRISYLDAASQALQTLLVTTAEWKDDSLKWTPESYGNISYIIKPAEEVWLPDFGIENSAGEFYNPTSHKVRLRIEDTGVITWSFGGHVITKCEIKVKKFPFDQQICDFSLINWMYDESAVNLTLTMKEMDTKEFAKSVEWRLLDTKCQRLSVVHLDRDGRTYPSIKCAMLLSRNPTFYIVNLFLPSYLILLLFLISFCLPPGHRATVPLQMTTLLIFSVMLLTISSKLPHSNDVPHITSFAICIMAIASISVTVTVSIAVIRSYMSTSLRLPKILRIIAIDYLSGPLCLKTIANDLNKFPLDEESAVAITLEEVDETADEDGTFLKNGDISKDLQLRVQLLGKAEEACAHLKNIESNTKSNPMKQHMSLEWDLFSKVVARTFFWIFFLAILGLSIDFAMTEASQSKEKL